MITLVSNYKYPIWTSYNWIFVIGYLCHSHVNYMSSFKLLVQLMKNTVDFFALMMFSKDFLISKFAIGTINKLEIGATKNIQLLVIVI